MIWRHLKQKLGVPSIFDICVCLFILIMPVIRIEALQRMSLVFGTIFLMCISIGRLPNRKYKSLPLCLLTLWGLVNIGLHSYGNQGEFATKWINWCLLNEGYLYIFFGMFLIHTVVSYGKSYRWYYLPIIISIGYIYRNIFDSYLGWSMTPLMALCIGGTLTLVKTTKRRLWGILVALIGIVVAILKLDWLIYKFKMRPVMWKLTIEKIKLLGNGFDNTINGMKGWAWSGPDDGWCYRHNDLLEFGEYYGIVGMVLITWFFTHLLLKGRPSVAYFFVITVLIMCSFQRTLFFPMHGGIFAVMVSLLILESGMAKKFLSQKEGR